MTDPVLTQANIYPALTYDDAPGAIEWLCRAFGFTQRLVVPGSDGAIAHSELSLGSGVIMVSSPKPEMGRVGAGSLPAVSQCISVWIENPDTHYERAKAAGAEIVHELQDEEYGSRGYMAKDVEGNLWYFGTYQPGAYWDESPSAGE
ncbi:MAG: VOC family protein [Pirellulaceae bacterium]